MTFTWDTANTGSSISSRHSLDPNDKTRIVVYKYRSGLPEPEITTQADLYKELEKASPSSSTLSFASKVSTSTTKSDPTSAIEPRFRVSRKSIPRGNSRIDVYSDDLWTEQEREEYTKFPSPHNSVASVGLPSSVYWRRLLFNSYPDLYIVSPVSTPNTSVNNSPEHSQHVSPQSTFPKDDNTTDS